MYVRSGGTCLILIADVKVAKVALLGITLYKRIAPRRLYKSNTTMSNQSNVFFHEESQSDRLARKSKEAPFFPIALGVCAAAVAYGAYMFKKRGQMSPSVFLMQLRVGAQGLAVGTLTLGLGYTMYREHFGKKASSD